MSIKQGSLLTRAVCTREQNKLKSQIKLHDEVDFDPETLEGLTYVGGVDLSFPKDDRERAVACLVVMKYPSFDVVYSQYLETRLHLPYIAGFLAFREVDPLLQLLQDLRDTRPDLYPQVILVDGNGRLHPRKCGIACHLGVLADTPMVGVAKNLLITDHTPSLKAAKAANKTHLHRRGDSWVIDPNEAAAVRTTDAAPNPVFVSPGHRVSLDTAIRLTLATSRFRIPEPIRRADLDSRAYVRRHLPDAEA